MPATRKALRTKRSTAARSTNAKTVSTSNGYAAKSDKNKSYNRSNKERKFVDTFFEDTIAGTGVVSSPSLVIVAGGTGASERVGRRILVTDIFIRGVHLLPSTSTAADTSDTYRTIVFLDRQANGAVAVTTDILNTASHLSFNNLFNVGRFKILSDKRTAFSANGGAVTVTPEFFSSNEKHFFIALKDLNIPIEYSGTDGAIDKITSNNIGILMISESGLVESEYIARMRYTD